MSTPLAPIKTVSLKSRQPNDVARQRNAALVARFNEHKLNVGDLVVMDGDLGNFTGNRSISGEAVCRIAAIGNGPQGTVSLRALAPASGRETPAAPSDCTAWEYDGWSYTIDPSNNGSLVDDDGYSSSKKVFLSAFRGRFDPAKTYKRVNHGRGD
jgi:hypothetical protein